MNVKAPDWIMWEPARWLVGTAELDAMTEFVFFRLCMIAYEAGNAVVPGSDLRNAMRCKVPAETYRNAVEILVELEKLERVEDGVFVKSAARRLEDAGSRITARQRGASIARRRGALKAEGRSPAEIDQIIRAEFPEHQPQKPTQTKQDTTEQDKTDRQKGGEGGKQADLLGDPVDIPAAPDAAEVAVKMWNDLASKHGLSRVQLLTDRRRVAVKARLKECGGLDGWAAALELVEGSDFLLGRKPGVEWKADFDFLLQAKSFTKLMEGGYSGRSAPRGSATMAELRKMADG